MGRLWLAAMLILVGCARPTPTAVAPDPESDRLARGSAAIVYDADRDSIYADVKSGTGILGMSFVPLPVGQRVTVLDDEGPGPDRSVRVGVDAAGYSGPALVPRPNLRPAP